MAGPGNGIARCPSSLREQSLRSVAFMPYRSSTFSICSDRNGNYRVDINRPPSPNTTFSQCLSLPSARAALGPTWITPMMRDGLFAPLSRELTMQIRCMQRLWWEELLRWAMKHDHVLLVAQELDFSFCPKHLHFVPNSYLIDDYQTALDLVLKRTPAAHLVPEELRFCFAALYAIDDYFESTPSSCMPGPSRLLLGRNDTTQAVAYVTALYRLWLGGLSLAEYRKWFRKLCHKGFTRLAHHLWREIAAGRGSFVQTPSPLRAPRKDADRGTSACALSSKPDVSEAFVLYVYSLATNDQTLLAFIEQERAWSKEFIARNLATTLPRYHNRPALFSAAHSFVAAYLPNISAHTSPSLNRGLASCQSLVAACACFNTSYISAVLLHCGSQAILRMHSDLLEVVRSADFPLLSAIRDTLTVVCPDLWHRLQQLNNFAVFRTALSVEQPHSKCVEVLLSSCAPHMLRPMLLSAGGRRTFCLRFGVLCHQNATSLLDTFRLYFPSDLWDDMVQYNTYAGALEAAKRGYLGVLEVIRQGTLARPRLWSNLLHATVSSPQAYCYPVDVSHYLYSEQYLRPLLEEDWRQTHLEFGNARLPPAGRLVFSIYDARAVSCLYVATGTRHGSGTTSAATDPVLSSPAAVQNCDGAVTSPATGTTDSGLGSQENLNKMSLHDYTPTERVAGLAFEPVANADNGVHHYAGNKSFVLSVQ